MKVKIGRIFVSGEKEGYKEGFNLEVEREVEKPEVIVHTYLKFREMLMKGIKEEICQ